MSTKRTDVVLDKRLQAIADMVEPCKLVADIGTDHGYLPCYLIQNEIAVNAIARDIAEMPLKRAEWNISKYHLQERITTQLLPGLQDLSIETDCVIIAGMGGYLIADILSKSTIHYPVYILQPNSNSELVRKKLQDIHYRIVDETIVDDGKKFYEIIKAIPGNCMLTETEIFFGPINLKKRETAFKSKHGKRLALLKSVLQDMNECSSSFSTVSAEIKLLESVLLQND